MNLPSGCDRRDVSASIQPGGRAVIVTYKWLDLMFDPVKFLEIYNCERTGRVMYNDDCAKSVAIAETAREMKGRFGAENVPFTSVMEIALPFQVQEEFRSIRNSIGTHVGLEVLNIHHEERNVWVTMFNLELTGLHSGYNPSMQTIPMRATAAKKPAPFKFTAENEDGRYHNGHNVSLPPFGGVCGVHSRASLSGCGGGVSPSPCTNANVTSRISSKRRRVDHDDAEDDAEVGDNDYND